MSELSEKIELFFQERTNDPNLYKPNPLRGWFEHIRILSVDGLIPQNITPQTGDLYSRLTGTVYRVFFYLPSMIAIYPDETILWLDDHANDLDYQTFITREHLIEWVPDHVNALAQLIVETKFTFLGMPHLLHNTSDILPRSEERKEILSQSADGREFLAAHEAALTYVSSQIVPPRVQTDAHGAMTLTLFLWTHIAGKVFKMECTFVPNTPFTYRGVQLNDFRYAAWLFSYASVKMARLGGLTDRPCLIKKLLRKR